MRRSLASGGAFAAGDLDNSSGSPLGNPIPLDHLQPGVIGAHATPADEDQKPASIDQLGPASRHPNQPGQAIVVAVVVAAVSARDPTTSAE
jgi:hypothetical protein